MQPDTSTGRLYGGLARTGELTRRDSGSWKVARASKYTQTSTTKPHAKTYSHTDMQNMAVLSANAEKQPETTAAGNGVT